MGNLKMKLKRAVAAIGVVGLLATAGLPGEAFALTASTGDLILGIFGNNTQYLHNLGPIGSVPLDTPIPLNDPFSQVGGANPVKYGLFAAFPDLVNFQTFGFTGSFTKPLADWSAGDMSAAFPFNAANTATFWISQTTPGALFEFIGSGNANSYTGANLWNGSPETYAGAFGVNSAGVPGSLLYLIHSELDFGTNQTTFMAMGTALLAADGHTIVISSANPIPLPAAVVLFGTGLIGLVGVARRKLTGQG